MKKNMKKSLWEVVKWMHEIYDKGDDDDASTELLVEPDASTENEEDAQEQSVAAGVAGVTTPLGTDSTYPNKKSAVAASGGNAKAPNTK